MTLNFGDEYSEGVRALNCPLCNDPYGLHIDDVYVLGRAEEDGPVSSVHVTHQSVISGPTENERLPGPQPQRRHSFNLGGWCELCDKKFVIGFEQHKGMTHVSVDELGE